MPPGASSPTRSASTRSGSTPIRRGDRSYPCSRAYTHVVAACSHHDHDLCMIAGGVFDHETMLVRRGRELMRKDGVGVVSVDVPELA